MLLFHQQQAAQWSEVTDSIDAYLNSVRELAEKMAVDGEQWGLENRGNSGRTISPWGQLRVCRGWGGPAAG